MDVTFTFNFKCHNKTFCHSILDQTKDAVEALQSEAFLHR